MDTLDTKNINDDIISYCGSSSGGAFASARRRNTCTLRSHSIISLGLKNSCNDNKHHSCHLGSKRGSCQTNLGDVIGGKVKNTRFNQCFHHYRFVIAMLSGVSVGLMLALRYNLTISILKMVNQTDLYLKEHPNSTYDDFLAAGYTPGGEFNWNNEIQQLLMSVYMVAYTLPQVPLSRLGEYIGCRVSISVTLFICALTNLLTPIVAYWGWEWLIALRLLNGLGAAALFPLGLSLVDKWMAENEISLGITYFQFFQSVMQALNPLVTGFLCDIHWKYAFYVPGAVCVMFCIMWFCLVTDDPEANWLISERELSVICGCSDLEKGKDQDTEKSEAVQSDKPYSASWSELMRNPKFIIYLLLWSLYCSTYCPFTYVIPNYLGQFLKIPVTDVGSLCFIIQIGQLIAMSWPHPLMRILEGSGNLSKKVAFKLVYTVICFASIGSWMTLGIFHCLQLFLITFNRSFHASQDVVIVASLMNSFVGSSALAFSIMNTIGNFTTVIMSACVGRWLDYTGRSPFGWTMVFAAFAFNHVIAWILFTVFITSEPINLDPKKKLKDKQETRAKEDPSKTYSVNFPSGQRTDGGESRVQS